MIPITTMIPHLKEDEPVLTGEELYPLVGSAVPTETIHDIQKQLKGMRRHWHCIPKAQAAQRILGAGVVVVGELMVWRVDMMGSYGYFFNPPYEVHSWLVLGKGGILDVALPGVIEMGLITADADGPILEHRSPVILNGRPEPWMAYRHKEIL